jgi:hypothetical protein
MENLDSNKIQKLYEDDPSFREGYRACISEVKNIIAERIKNTKSDGKTALSCLSSELSCLRLSRTSAAINKK